MKSQHFLTVMDIAIEEARKRKILNDPDIQNEVEYLEQAYVNVQSSLLDEDLNTEDCELKVMKKTSVGQLLESWILMHVRLRTVPQVDLLSQYLIDNEITDFSTDELQIALNGTVETNPPEVLYEHDEVIQYLFNTDRELLDLIKIRMAKQSV